MPKATLYKTTGEILDIVPANGKAFTLEELRETVGGTVQWVPLPSGKVFICHDEGRLIPLPVNENAGKEWAKEYPIEKYPHNNVDSIHGDIIISDPQFTQ